jgi:hypothetical protein
MNLQTLNFPEIGFIPRQFDWQLKIFFGFFPDLAPWLMQSNHQTAQPSRRTTGGWSLNGRKMTAMNHEKRYSGNPVFKLGKMVRRHGLGAV